MADSPKISNPTPIAPGLCGIYWVASFTAANPLLAAVLRPFDGLHVIGNRSLEKRITVDVSKDAAGLAIVEAIFAQVQRLAGKTIAVQSVIMSEADPLTPIPLIAIWSDGSLPYRIPDLMALAASDAQVAQVYADFIAYLASKVV